MEKTRPGLGHGIHALFGSLVAAGLLTCVAGGSGSGRSSVSEDGQDGGVELEVLLETRHSGREAPLRRVVREDTAWRSFWSGLDLPTDAAGETPPNPEVDFGTSMVLVAGLGRRGGGFSVRIGDVRRMEDGLEAVVVESRPGPDCMTVQVITTPLTAVRVPATPGTVSFRDSVEVRPCGDGADDDGAGGDA